MIIIYICIYIQSMNSSITYLMIYIDHPHSSSLILSLLLFYSHYSRLMRVVLFVEQRLPRKSFVRLLFVFSLKLKIKYMQVHSSSLHLYYFIRLLFHSIQHGSRSPTRLFLPFLYVLSHVILSSMPPFSPRHSSYLM